MATPVEGDTGQACHKCLRFRNDEVAVCLLVTDKVTKKLAFLEKVAVSCAAASDQACEIGFNVLLLGLG